MRAPPITSPAVWSFTEKCGRGSFFIHRVCCCPAPPTPVPMSSASTSTGMCTNEKWAVSIPPSHSWAQLASWSFLVTKRFSGGTVANSIIGSSGWCSGGPR